LCLQQIHGVTYFTIAMVNHPQTVAKAVLDRIRGHGRGWVFTPRHFLDLGTRGAVATALKRHTDAGRIRQLARGLYDYPRSHPQLGLLAPAADAIAQALAGRDAVRLQPTGGYAANQLGLSDQVPMKVVFLTDGPSRRVVVGRQEIVLRRTTPRSMATARRVSGLVIQALRFLGRRHVDQQVMERLRSVLTAKDRAALRRDLRHAPAWIADAMRRVARSAEDWSVPVGSAPARSSVTDSSPGTPAVATCAHTCSIREPLCP